MKPRPMETIHTTHEGLPTVAATAPMENSTSGGTPLATQNAPVQSMPRSRPDDWACAVALAAGRSFAVLLKLPPYWPLENGETRLCHTAGTNDTRGADGKCLHHSLRIRSPGGIVAAIDREIGARYVAGAVGGEEVH